jgi:hypothetical protein
MLFTLASLAALFIGQAVATVAQWGQCGGIGYSGDTQCVSGCVCTKLNDYYYQCLAGTTTTTQPSSTTTSSTPTSTPTSGITKFLGGVNLAGFDFSAYTDGSWNGTGVDPPISQIDHFAKQGVNIFRVPFGWQLATPQLGGQIDSNFLSRYDKVVNAALAASTQPYVIIDLHNYARWNGGIIGQGGPSNDQFANIWSQFASHYKSQSRIIFGIMNEPHDVPDLNKWGQSVQAAVNAIRAAGATSQYILIPGSSWSSAQALPNEAGPILLGVTDPAGGKNKLLFDVHKYLDSDNSGTHAECTTDNVSVMTTLANWLQQNGRQAILSETGGGNTASCQTALKSQLAYVKSRSAQIAGFTIWSAGSFDTTYVLSVTPNGDTDNALWTNAVKPNLP